VVRSSGTADEGHTGTTGREADEATWAQQVGSH